jgi:hypothetical protein
MARKWAHNDVDWQTFGAAMSKMAEIQWTVGFGRDDHKNSGSRAWSGDALFNLPTEKWKRTRDRWYIAPFTCGRHNTEGGLRKVRGETMGNRAYSTHRVAYYWPETRVRACIAPFGPKATRTSCSDSGDWGWNIFGTRKRENWATEEVLGHSGLPYGGIETWKWRRVSEKKI